MAYELKEYLKSINTSKQNVMDSDDKMWEKRYASFIVNKCLAPFNDTVMLVNEMNFHHHLDNKLQYDYLINRIRPKKRFKKWDKKQDNENIEIIKEYYRCNNDKARVTLSLLSEQQLDIIKKKLNKGGVK